MGLVEYIDDLIKSYKKMGCRPTAIILGHTEYAHLSDVFIQAIRNDTIPIEKKMRLIEAQTSGEIVLFDVPVYIVGKKSCVEVAFAPDEAELVSTINRELKNVQEGIKEETKVVNMADFKRKKRK